MPPSSQQGERIRIAILEDNPTYLKGLLATLDGEDDIEIVGTAETPEELTQILADEDIRVVVVDMMLDRNTEAEGLRLVGKGGLPRNVKRILLTAFPDEQSFVTAIDGGASAYVRKEPREYQLPVADLIRLVAKGGRWFDPATVAALREHIDESSLRSARALGRPLRLGAHDGPPSTLSDRMLQVLELLARGLSNKEIGERLHISVNTVKVHVRNVRQALGAASREDAVVRAFVAGLLRREKDDEALEPQQQGEPQR